MRYLPAALILFAGLSGCVLPGQSAYINDPFTGGVNSAASNMLHIPLPAGLQYYPSHSKISGGARKEGLEVWRGYIDAEAAARQIYDNLKQRGWQPRMTEKAGERSLYLYERQGEFAVIVFQKQGALTIVQIWTGPRLSASAPFDEMSGEPAVSVAGEEYSPAASGKGESGEKGKVETWGVGERDL